jgi:hypothetical protein
MRLWHISFYHEGISPGRLDSVMSDLSRGILVSRQRKSLPPPWMSGSEQCRGVIQCSQR